MSALCSQVIIIDGELHMCIYMHIARVCLYGWLHIPSFYPYCTAKMPKSMIRIKECAQTLYLVVNPETLTPHIGPSCAFYACCLHTSWTSRYLPSLAEAGTSLSTKASTWWPFDAGAGLLLHSTSCMGRLHRVYRMWFHSS